MISQRSLPLHSPTLEICKEYIVYLQQVEWVQAGECVCLNALDLVCIDEPKQTHTQCTRCLPSNILPPFHHKIAQPLALRVNTWNRQDVWAIHNNTCEAFSDKHMCTQHVKDRQRQKVQTDKEREKKRQKKHLTDVTEHWTVYIQVDRKT